MSEIKQAGLCSVGLKKTLDSMITLTTFHGEIRIAQLSEVNLSTSISKGWIDEQVTKMKRLRITFLFSLSK